MQTTIIEDVQASIEALDVEYGSPHWRQIINPKMLSMTSLSSCILGQVFGDLSRAPDNLFEGPGRLGFNCGVGRNTSFNHIQNLQAEWLRRLAWDKGIRLEYETRNNVTVLRRLA
jgi:hypothetical protein